MPCSPGLHGRRLKTGELGFLTLTASAFGMEYRLWPYASGTDLEATCAGLFVALETRWAAARELRALAAGETLGWAGDLAALLSWGRWGRPGRTRGRAWVTTLGPLGVGRREADAILDATLIGAAPNTEEAAVTPITTP